MIGQTISHYKILEKLGEGGMGVVYKAQDTTLNRLVALKFLHTIFTRDEDSRSRFITEAQAASALEHHNICNIHEIDESNDGQQFICMAYYHGENLAKKIKGGPLQLEEALNIIYQIAQGLDRAHKEKIIHRDVKPSNIIIDKDDNVKIVDFGLAKLMGDDLTQTVSTKGTVAYMAPEVIRGLQSDHRADLWSLGIILYEMLTGHLPFEGKYSEPLMYSIVNQPPKSLSEYIAEVPDLLQNIIDKFLQKEPKKRYQNIEEFLDDIEPLIEENSALSIRTRPRIVKVLKRERKLLYSSLALLLLILFVFISKPYLFPEISSGNSIAVLPLESFTQDSEQEWFSDGVTDALISELAQISALKVISRPSSMQYKRTNKSSQEIAAELGVKYLVDGSVVRKGNLIIFRVRLVDVLKDEYILSKKYEREFMNILSLQSEITRAIADQLEVQLTPEEERRLAKRRPVNPETYVMYMKGMYHLNKLTPEGIKKGLGYLERAVENNPDESLAHAGIAIAYCLIAHGASYTPDVLSEAKTATLKALELDELLPEAHLALSMVEAFYELDWKSAIKSNKRALELNPNFALAHYFYGYLHRLQGQFEEGYHEMIQAKQLDPLNPVYPADLGWMFYGDRKFDESIEECLKSLDINPEFPQAYFVLGQAYASKGMYEEAITANKKAGELSINWRWGLAHTYAVAGFTDEARKIAIEIEKRNLDWDTWCLAVVYAELGDADKVFYWLEQAYQKRHPFIQWIGKANRLYFGAYYDDPRFKDLAQRLNIL